MFSLNYKTDDTITVGGEQFSLDLSFGTVLRFFELMEDSGLEDWQKIPIAAGLLLTNDEDASKVDDWELIKAYEFVQAISDKFFRDGDKEERVDRLGNVLPSSKSTPEQNYCFKHDAEYIYASFMQAYRIDLIEERKTLHWVKFKALLNGLPDGTKFREVLGIRTRELPTGKGTEKERKNLKELKKHYALPGKEVEEYE